MLLLKCTKMFSNSERRKGALILLILPLITFGMMALLTGFDSLPMSVKLKDNFCITEPTLEIVDNRTVQAWTSPNLDTWDASDAINILKMYNLHLNNNEQPIAADPNNTSTITQWWQAAAMISWYLKSPLRYNCKDLIWYGNWAVCQDIRFAVESPCLVYSFGIAFDFRFDDAIGDLGCDVRSFDPSMQLADHKRGEHVMFYNTGLGSSNTDVYHPMKNRYVTTDQTWRIRTLKAIRRELGHSKRVLDVLKMDIETFEWSVLDNIMESDLLKYVRHLLVEYHLFSQKVMPLEDYVIHFHVLTRLRQLGFREYYSTPHSEILKPDHYNQQGEVFYVNYNFNPNILQMSNYTESV